MPKQFQVDIKRYDPDVEDGAEFDTWLEAAEWLQSQRPYFGIGCGMWVNGDRVKFHGPHLVNAEPEVISDKPVSDQLFDGITRFVTDFDKTFRPQPTRGSAPTNPSTFATKGESL